MEEISFYGATLQNWSPAAKSNPPSTIIRVRSKSALALLAYPPVNPGPAVMYLVEKDLAPVPDHAHGLTCELPAHISRGALGRPAIPWPFAHPSV